MNRNLDGTPLSREQLLDLALEAGMSPEKNTLDAKTSVFIDESRGLRHAMFMRGELVLDTRPVPRPSRLPLQVDWVLVAFITGGKVTGP